MLRHVTENFAPGHRWLPAALLLAFLITVAGCGQKKASVAAAPKAEVTAEADTPPAPAQQASAPSSTGFLPDPKATIDNVKQKLDAAAALEQKRRDAIEDQGK
jgi:hypothetical protein